MTPLYNLELGGPAGIGPSLVVLDTSRRCCGPDYAHPREGLDVPINATAPEPLRQSVFARTLGRVMRRPAFIPTPAWSLRLMLGEFSSELLSSRRVLSQRAEEIGYRFRFPTLTSSLQDVLGGSIARWIRDKGTSILRISGFICIHTDGAYTHGIRGAETRRSVVEHGVFHHGTTQGK